MVYNFFMEFKANLFYKIFFGIISIIFIIMPFYVLLNENIFTEKLWFIILLFISCPLLIFIFVDELYQLFRVIIIDENIVKIKIFGKIIREEKIETIEYNNKHYGVRKLTHMVGSVKSIIVNKKYFSCITKMDNNFERIKL
jgi:hypothetical protein